MESISKRLRSVALWAAVGGLWAFAVLGIASIGWFLMPVALLVTLVAAGQTRGQGLPALAVGAIVVAVSLLAVQAVTLLPEVGGGAIAPE